MTDRANIKLDREEFEKHNERREEMGLSWAEYIDGEAPDPPDAGPVTLEATEYPKIAEEVAKQLR
jgi:hypothetical protein